MIYEVYTDYGHSTECLYFQEKVQAETYFKECVHYLIDYLNHSLRHPAWDGVDDDGLRTEDEALERGGFSYDDVSAFITEWPYEGTEYADTLYIVVIDDFDEGLQKAVFDTKEKARSYFQKQIQTYHAEKDMDGRTKADALQEGEWLLENVEVYIESWNNRYPWTFSQ